MRIDGRLFAQGFEDIDLAWCVVNMVVATYHVGDGHVHIVHHHAKVVCGCADLSQGGGAGNHQVVQLIVADFNATFDFVIPHHRTRLRVFKTQNGLNACWHGWQSFAVFRPPSAVVTWLLFGSHLFFTQGIQFGHTHVTRVNVSAGQ